MTKRETSLYLSGIFFLSLGDGKTVRRDEENWAAPDEKNGIERPHQAVSSKGGEMLS